MDRGRHLTWWVGHGAALALVALPLSPGLAQAPTDRERQAAFCVGVANELQLAGQQLVASAHRCRPGSEAACFRAGRSMVDEADTIRIRFGRILVENGIRLGGPREDVAAGLMDANSAGRAVQRACAAAVAGCAGSQGGAGPGGLALCMEGKPACVQVRGCHIQPG